jgi:hypothetical protein
VDLLLKKLWKGNNIWNTVKNAGNSLAEINASEMHSCWKRLCTGLAYDFLGFEETPGGSTEEAVHLMNEMNLYVSSENVD